ncbi:MAG: cytochrome P450, partial [Gemmataceae bacterium]
RTHQMEKMAHVDGLEAFFEYVSNRMLFTDPPKHTRLRGLVKKAFTPPAIGALRPHIQELVDGFLNAVQPHGRMDVMADLAFPLPATVIAGMLGLPAEDRVQMKHWSDELLVYFSADPGQVTPESYQQATRSLAAMTEYFRKIFAERRVQPRDDLLTALQQVEAAGDRLNAIELYANTNLLLTAGHETTTSLIGNGVLALLKHPEQLQKLRDDPTLIPHAIEEFIRYDGPVQFTHRVAAEDIEMGGKVIRKGQFIYLLLAAANRDPEHFPDPDRLDVTRPHNKHLGFGMGAHFCLGAPLARLETQIAFTTLLERFPALKLATEQPRYRDNFNLHGLVELPVTF